MRCRTQATVRIIFTGRNLWQAALRTSAGASRAPECFYNVSMMEELQTILSLGAGGVSKRVVRETGWIERANNPKISA